MPKLKLVFTVDVRNDILSAFQSTEEKIGGSADALSKELWEKVEQIAENPFDNTKSEHDNIYFISFEKFAYKLVYCVNNAFIRVFALLDNEQMSAKITEALMKQKYNEMVKK